MRVKLDNIASDMNDEATSLFEDVCSTFLDEQLSIAIPPIFNIQCTVTSQSVESGRRRRRLGELNKNEGSSLNNMQRVLASALIVDLDVAGEAEKTDSIQEASDVKFQDLLVGTFTVQGYLFLNALKKDDRGGAFTFQSTQNIRGVHTSDGAQVQTPDDEGNGNGGGLTKGLIAAIVLGGVFFLILSIFIFARVVERRRVSQLARNNLRKPREDFFGDMTKKESRSSDSKAKLAPETASPTSSFITATISPRSHEDVLSDVVSPVANSSGDVEVDLIPSSFSNKNQGGSSSLLSSRIRRDVMAPPGKLGILVANTTGYGPAVHTVRPGSPMEGLVFVDDIIIAMNDINTRDWTAEQLTQVMKDTAKEGRKITVLSAHR